MTLGQQETGEDSGVAVSHDAERLAGLTVDQNGDVPVATAEAGLVDQEDPAAAPAPIRRHPVRP